MKPQKHKGTKKAQKQLPRWDFVFNFHLPPGNCFVKFGVLVAGIEFVLATRISISKYDSTKYSLPDSGSVAVFYQE